MKNKFKYGGGVLATLLLAILFCFAACKNSSSEDDSVSGSGKANPFSGTEWSGGGSSLKFYSDGTVGGSAASTSGLRYKVSSSGGSYTATIYAEAYGQTVNFATLTISSENATSGTYKLDGSGVSATLQKVGGSSTNGSGSISSGSSDKDDSNSNDNNESYSKGTKGGSSGDQFINTTWNGDGLSLAFGKSGNVTYTADRMNFYYDYYFKSTGGSYTATIYENNTLMLTFEFSIANPTSGKLTFGSSNSSSATLKRYTENSYPTNSGSSSSVNNDSSSSNGSSTSSSSSGAFPSGTKWVKSSDSSSIEFKDNGQVIMNGVSSNYLKYTYSSGYGQITSSSTVLATFTISGNTLTYKGAAMTKSETYYRQ